MNTIIGIQGITGSFHHQVAQEYFNHEFVLDECLSFEELVDSLLAGKSEQAIMAIENSIAGPIIPNYALIDKNNLHIIGEHYLNIHQNLMALKGQKIEDILEVHSHPMALLQCMDFLKKYPNIKLVEDKDTAETARRIQEKQLKGIAAIASKTASEMYDLEIIAPEIQTIKNNMTRFVIIKKENSFVPESEINRASIKFELDHKRGSLAAVLNVMSDCKLNLTKIQSLPKIETPWKYSFFVDVTFEKYEDYAKAKSLLNIMAEYFKVLGEYKNTKI
ncbi:Bifunctional chorismate mutase/prephenate dehydratase [Flavobacterium sp. CECT 9288]|uniref:prephenate dehydratase n=1 Tax=Flavobacterium sp. CECT 9288 TaxID=2845819 RepID=UPI001E3E335F|nr:prephenate dehydratase [Flavobacterium sp. CECT 9288]CAH0334681.1 Bifunctional chorismate mutase/prephenate dehydratase [Flavobacterium sp. CECT 9288]